MEIGKKVISQQIKQRPCNASQQIQATQVLGREAVEEQLPEPIEPKHIEKQMKEAARMMEFEYAAVLRDQIIELRGND